MDKLKCVCGSVATTNIFSYAAKINIIVCESCKWKIENDEHDEPSDHIRKLLQGDQ